MQFENCSKLVVLRLVGGRRRYVYVFINEMLSWFEGYILIGSQIVVVYYIQRGKFRFYYFICEDEFEDVLLV